MDNKPSYERKGRKKRRKFNYKPILLFSALILIAFFAINSIFSAMEPNGAAEAAAYMNIIDVSQIIIERNDIERVYRFFYEDWALDMHRHRFIDDDNLLELITFNPNEHILSVHTALPAYFDIFYDYESHTAYIRIIHPKDIYDKIVIIDPGDGGYHPGAVVGDIFESNINLAMGLFLYEIFAESGSGIRAFLTRDTDIFVSNPARIEFANRLGHLFISIQNNAYGGATAPFVYGTEVLYSNIREENAILAQILQNELVSELETRDRGILLRNDIHVLGAAEIPAAMAEVDFMTSPNSLANLLDANFQYRAARAIYRGIVYAFDSVLNDYFEQYDYSSN